MNHVIVSPRRDAQVPVLIEGLKTVILPAWCGWGCETATLQKILYVSCCFAPRMDQSCVFVWEIFVM